jgi:5-methylcytosine-specific restriction endonuclease McrA
MFENRGLSTSGSAGASAGRLDVSAVRAWAFRLGADVGSGLSDAERVGLIGALEDLANAARGAQAVVTAAFDASQRAEQARAGVPVEQQGRGVAAQVALARRESPHRGQQHLGLARVLTQEMPRTLAAFRSGRVTEWQAMVMARETACLTLADRRRVDEELAGDPAALEALVARGERQLVVACQRLAAQLDPAAVVARRRHAESQRRVSLRPAPDTMSQLSALLPVAQGVAVYAALVQSADTARASGDERSRGQVMADTLVERVTGQSSAPAVPVRVNLVIPDRTLLAGGDDPAQLVAAGLTPTDLPGHVARDLVLESLADGGAWTTLRRLYAAPESGQLVAMESRSRLFPRALAELVRLRDQTCRTPWCYAPVRHADHVVAHADGGATSYANGQGLCQACNHAKQAPGWSARPRAGPENEVETTTPTGHRYRSTAPPVHGDPTRAPASRLELQLAELVLIA